MILLLILLINSANQLQNTVSSCKEYLSPSICILCEEGFLLTKEYTCRQPKDYLSQESFSFDLHSAIDEEESLISSKGENLQTLRLLSTPTIITTSTSIVTLPIIILVICWISFMISLVFETNSGISTLLYLQINWISFQNLNEEHELFASVKNWKYSGGFDIEMNNESSRFINSFNISIIMMVVCLLLLIITYVRIHLYIYRNKLKLDHIENEIPKKLTKFVNDYQFVWSLLFICVSFILVNFVSHVCDYFMKWHNNEENKSDIGGIFIIVFVLTVIVGVVLTFLTDQHLFYGFKKELKCKDTTYHYNFPVFIYLLSTVLIVKLLPFLPMICLSLSAVFLGYTLLVSPYTKYVYTLLSAFSLLSNVGHFYLVFFYQNFLSEQEESKFKGLFYFNLWYLFAVNILWLFVQIYYKAKLIYLRYYDEESYNEIKVLQNEIIKENVKNMLIRFYKIKEKVLGKSSKEIREFDENVEMGGDEESIAVFGLKRKKNYSKKSVRVVKKQESESKSSSRSSKSYEASIANTNRMKRAEESEDESQRSKEKGKSLIFDSKSVNDYKTSRMRTSKMQISQKLVKNKSKPASSSSSSSSEDEKEMRKTLKNIQSMKNVIDVEDFEKGQGNDDTTENLKKPSKKNIKSMKVVIIK